MARGPARPATQAVEAASMSGTSRREQQLRKLSRFLSMLLRHQPARFPVALDDQGVHCALRCDAHSAGAAQFPLGDASGHRRRSWGRGTGQVSRSCRMMPARGYARSTANGGPSRLCSSLRRRRALCCRHAGARAGGPGGGTAARRDQLYRAGVHSRRGTTPRARTRPIRPPCSPSMRRPPWPMAVRSTARQRASTSWKSQCLAMGSATSTSDSRSAAASAGRLSGPPAAFP